MHVWVRQLQETVRAARHKCSQYGNVRAARHKCSQHGNVRAARHKCSQYSNVRAARHKCSQHGNVRTARFNFKQCKPITSVLSSPKCLIFGNNNLISLMLKIKLAQKSAV